MGLWELGILLAPIMWAYECGKDVANSESCSAKKLKNGKSFYG